MNTGKIEKRLRLEGADGRWVDGCRSENPAFRGANGRRVNAGKTKIPVTFKGER